MMKAKTDEKKPRSFRISIKYKIWIAILATVLLVAGLLWIFQQIFLEDAYLSAKRNELEQLTAQVSHSLEVDGVKAGAATLARVGYANNVCGDISFWTGRPKVRYEGLGEGCPMHISDEAKDSIRTLVIDSSKPYNIIETYSVIHPEMGTEYYTSACKTVDKFGGSYIVFLTTPLAPLKESIGIMQKFLVYIIIFMTIAATVIAFLVARTMTKSIRNMSQAANMLAKGDFDVNLNVKSRDELGELCQSLEHMTKELSKVNRLQRELVANISHDMRTPLTMIRGYAETIKDITGDDKEKRNHQLNIIVEEVQRLSMLVSDVMDLSQLQAGELIMHEASFDIVERARVILDRFGLLEETSGFTFMLEGNASAMVMGDELRIEQVLYNLLSNAVNHIGEEKRITVTVEVGIDETRVSVLDTGCGISETDLPMIWDRYYKPYKKAGAKGIGTGLGLSIVKAILIGHQAKFGVDSVLGSGSCFWFTLKNAKEIK